MKCPYCGSPLESHEVSLVDADWVCLCLNEECYFQGRHANSKTAAIREMRKTIIRPIALAAAVVEAASADREYSKATSIARDSGQTSSTAQVWRIVSRQATKKRRLRNKVRRLTRQLAGTK